MDKKEQTLKQSVAEKTDDKKIDLKSNEDNQTPSKSVYAGKKKSLKKKKFNKKSEKPQDEFEQRIVDLARVTRVMAGGKRMRFRACVVIGNKKGKIGVGLGKGADVTMAINKGVNMAKKNIVTVPIVNETIPHEIYEKYGAAKILLKPAKRGRGVICGGAIRVMVELAGIHNITSKNLGTTNKVTIAKSVIRAFQNLRQVENKENKKLEILNPDKVEVEIKK